MHISIKTKPIPQHKIGPLHDTRMHILKPPTLTQINLLPQHIARGQYIGNQRQVLHFRQTNQQLQLGIYMIHTLILT